MPATNESVIRRLFDEVLNQGNLALADQIVARESVDNTSSMIGVPGIDTFKKNVTMFRQAMPDLRYTVEYLDAFGDKVVVHWSARGTLTGELRGFQPNGKQATVAGTIVYRVVDGKIVESCGSWDALGLLLQLDVIPAAAVPWAATPAPPSVD
jgi:predicted ester cyclase